MLDRIRHRGPDGSGARIDTGVALGCVRLACVGLEGGRRPFSNEAKTVWTVCNGEIFNYRELRRELEARGHIFRTRTDVEVLPHLYEEYGIDRFSRLNGQYAFALWDDRYRRLVLCRDRLGICPLYYTQRNGTLYFASEVKALMAVPDLDISPDLAMLAATWTLWAPLPGRTLFRNVVELLPAHYATYNVPTQSLTTARYWQITFAAENWTERAATDALSEVLVDAWPCGLRQMCRSRPMSAGAWTQR